MTARLKFNDGNPVLIYDGAGSTTLAELGLHTTDELKGLRDEVAATEVLLSALQTQLSAWATQAQGEVVAKEQRIAELEAQLATETAARETATDLALVAETERDAARADVARLREALLGLLDAVADTGTGEFPAVVHATRFGSEALSSAGATEWLRERDLRTAERVKKHAIFAAQQGDCGCNYAPCEHDDQRFRSARRVRELDLAALFSEGR